MAITIRSYESALAPAMFGNVGAMIPIFDFCLIPAGWTKLFSETNYAVYQQPGAAPKFLYVNDSVTTYTSMRMFDTATAMTAAGVVTGTNPTPGTGQNNTGSVVTKANASGAGPRCWYFISNGRTFYLATDSTAPTWSPGGAASVTAVGEFTSAKVGDTHNCVILGDLFGVNPTTAPILQSAVFPGLNTGAFISRPHAQVGTSVQVSKTSDTVSVGGGAGNGCAGLLPFPNPIDGGITLQRMYLAEPLAGRRGHLAGAWAWCHAVGSAGMLDTFTGAGDLAGKSFVCIKVQNTGIVVLETTDTWST